MIIEDSKKAINFHEGNILIDIEVSTNSNDFSFKGFNQWRNRFEFRIKEIPQKGKANKEIIKKFSELFSCDVGIFKGEKSHQKTIILYDISLEDVLEKINKGLNI